MTSSAPDATFPPVRWGIVGASDIADRVMAPAMREPRRPNSLRSRADPPTGPRTSRGATARRATLRLRRERARRRPRGRRGLRRDRGRPSPRGRAGGRAPRQGRPRREADRARRGRGGTDGRGLPARPASGWAPASTSASTPATSGCAALIGEGAIGRVAAVRRDYSGRVAGLPAGLAPAIRRGRAAGPSSTAAATSWTCCGSCCGPRSSRSPR